MKTMELTVKLFLVLTLLLGTVALRAAEQAYPPYANVVDVTRPPYGATKEVKRGEGHTVPYSGYRKP